MAMRQINDYGTDEEIVAGVERLGSLSALAQERQIKLPSFRSHVNRQDALRERVLEATRTHRVTTQGKSAKAAFAEDVHAHLKRKRGKVTVSSLADDLDVAPNRIRTALDALREKGVRIPEEEDGHGVTLQKVVPDKTSVHKSLLEGTELEVGLVSDTHMSSNEEALGELHLAYDTFAERGITEVWHPGDFIAGMGIFRTQAAEIKNHTLDAQIEYCAEHYPKRKGIVTRGISGNHDWGGEAARAGIDPVIAIANQREDIDYLGPTSAWIELPNGAYAHLLHGSGAMSYSVDYKALKLVDGYPAGRKPSILCVGHWHVAGWSLRRNVNVLFPGCFEWRSPFLAAKGLSPAVGFYVLHLTLGKDGSLVKFMPEFHQFFEGRTAG